ncbi:unnamed protein product [Nesidiocoris tenuis]|uniref:CHK kinase-like domain-containing protein n=2 Tax=Nesidiocoris tenuis TaxID=355587 RepID=A0A6H5G170_9HEMI|nr:unnamed protein product [Nesidiocoris tenuis]
MKAFGKFHGLSRILLQRGELPLDIFRDHMSTKDEDKNRFVEDGLKVLIRKCDQWGDECLVLRNQEAEIDVNWLELILRRKSYEESVVRVLDFQQNGELEKGENFMSKIRRIKAKVLLGSGTLKTVSYIVKTQHETENLKRMSVEFGLFFREITMYRDILPKMEALLDEAGITEERPWGKCVGVRLYDTLILEDLTMEGYKLVDRKKQLGLTAALLVIKVFGKFHALSRILLQRGDIPFDVFQKYMATKNGGENQFVCDGLKKLVKKCQEWGDEWDEATRRMRNILPHFGEKFNQALSTPSDEFNVLVHCDAWPNNMLFKYDEDPENPTSAPRFSSGFHLYACARPSHVPHYIRSHGSSMKQLGLQASLLVMKQLGKFHALSKILLDRGEIPMDIFGHHVWVNMEERNVAIHADVLTKYDKTMESWGEEWCTDKFCRKWRSCSMKSETPVLGHGENASTTQSTAE